MSEAVQKKPPQLNVRFPENFRENFKELKEKGFNHSAFIRRKYKKLFERMAKQKIK